MKKVRLLQIFTSTFLLLGFIPCTYACVCKYGDEIRKSDLDAWLDVLVEALDIHSLFLTMPMVKPLTASGLEICNYVNKQGMSNCVENA